MQLSVRHWNKWTKRDSNCVQGLSSILQNEHIKCPFHRCFIRSGGPGFAVTSLLEKIQPHTQYAQESDKAHAKKKKERRWIQWFGRVSKTSLVCIMWVSRLERCGETVIIVICQDDLLGHDNSATPVRLWISTLKEQKMWVLLSTRRRKKKKSPPA